jgi:hypothetical protein
MLYRVLADVVMTFHLLFLAFVVFGGFLAWRWPKVWFAHAPLALYGLVTVTFGLICPLTPIEHDLRQRAGQEGLEPTGFIDTYIEGLIYPADQTLLARWLAFAVIVVSWAGLAVILRRRRGRRGAARGAAQVGPGSSGSGPLTPRRSAPRTGRPGRSVRVRRR